MTKKNTLIFDLGNVLIHWDPKRVFDETYFETAEQRDYFFSNICTMDWNEQQDAGRSIVEATQELVTQYPEWEAAIRDYYGRWTEMLGGPITATVDLFRQLKESGRYKIYALTNWHQGLFDIALVRYDFLHWFDGRVVSGEEKLKKPDPLIYQRLLDRYAVNPSEAIFIDDSLRNVQGAQALGIDAIRFISPALLEQELIARQII